MFLAAQGIVKGEEYVYLGSVRCPSKVPLLQER
jgi:hypothetical protein